MRAFSPFLPQDNEETPESETVVLAIADGLYGLLKCKAEGFWEEVKSNKSLSSSLGTYLQFCRCLAYSLMVIKYYNAMDFKTAVLQDQIHHPLVTPKEL